MQAALSRTGGWHPQARPKTCLQDVPSVRKRDDANRERDRFWGCSSSRTCRAPRPRFQYEVRESKGRGQPIGRMGPVFRLRSRDLLSVLPFPEVLNTPTTRILLVDEKHEGLLYNLLAEVRGQTRRDLGGRGFFDQGQWNLIVLDLMLPLLDGYEVARQSATGIPACRCLMLTARSAKTGSKGLQCRRLPDQALSLAGTPLAIKGMLQRA